MIRRRIETKDGEVYNLNLSEDGTEIKENSLGTGYEISYRKGFLGRIHRTYIDKSNIKSDVEGCCLATLIYGTTLCGGADERKLDVLRNFREDLRRGEVTTIIVDVYYSRTSVKLTELIRDHVPSSIPAIRKGLDFIVENYGKRIG